MSAELKREENPKTESPEFGTHTEIDFAEEVISSSTPSADFLEQAVCLGEPLETHEDLERALDFLSSLSPELAQTVSEARENVPIELGERSAALRKTQEVLDRESTYASKVTFARGSPTALLEIVHELQHALPHPNHAEPLDFDPKVTPRDEIVQKLKAHFYYEEAYSVEQEIKLIERLESLGVYLDYEAVRPGVREVYEQEGVGGIAARLIELIPPYEPHYADLTERIADDLLHKRDFEWSDGGVSGTFTEGGLKIEFDPEKLQHKLAEFNSIINSGEISQLIDQAQELIPKRVVELIQKLFPLSQAAPQEEAPLERVEPREVESNARIKPQPIPVIDLHALDQDKSKTVLRATSAGRLPKFVSHARKDLDDKATAKYFSAICAEAEANYGQKSAALYRELLDFVATEPDGKSRKLHLEDLGFSLVKSGYREEGVALLTAYREKYANGFSNDTALFYKKLVEHDIKEVAAPIPGRMLHSMEQFKSYFKDNLLSKYDKNGFPQGEFTPRGEQLAFDFLEEHEDSYLVSHDFHEFVIKLKEQGEYRLVERDEMRESTYDYTEEDRYQWMCELGSTAATLPAAQAHLDNADPAHEDVGGVVDRFFAQAKFGAKGASVLRIHSWEKKFGVIYDESKGLEDVFDQLLQADNVNKEYEFRNEVNKEVRRLIYTKLSTGEPEDLRSALESLYTLDARKEEVEIYKKVSKQIPQDFSSEELSEFVKHWEDAATAASQKLKNVDFIETSIANHLELPKAKWLTKKE